MFDLYDSIDYNTRHPSFLKQNNLLRISYSQISLPQRLIDFDWSQNDRRRAQRKRDNDRKDGEEERKDVEYLKK